MASSPLPKRARLPRRCKGPLREETEEVPSSAQLGRRTEAPLQVETGEDLLSALSDDCLLVIFRTMNKKQLDLVSLVSERFAGLAASIRRRYGKAASIDVEQGSGDDVCLKVDLPGLYFCKTWYFDPRGREQTAVFKRASYRAPQTERDRLRDARIGAEARSRPQARLPLPPAVLADFALIAHRYAIQTLRFRSFVADETFVAFLTGLLDAHSHEKLDLSSLTIDRASTGKACLDLIMDCDVKNVSVSSCDLGGPAEVERLINTVAARPSPLHLDYSGGKASDAHWAIPSAELVKTLTTLNRVSLSIIRLPLAVAMRICLERLRIGSTGSFHVGLLGQFDDSAIIEAIGSDFTAQFKELHIGAKYEARIEIPGNLLNRPRGNLGTDVTISHAHHPFEIAAEFRFQHFKLTMSGVR